jgi:crotonobetainyl-CoA:carnitine CoA-transferase CaiB-like acyl-CoA transferase
MKEKPYAAWAALFEEMDVPHAPAQWTEDLLDDPQVKHERMVISVLDPLAGPMDQMGPTVTFDAHPWQQPGPAPRPGEHTDAICRELGIVPAEIEALRRAGAIL